MPGAAGQNGARMGRRGRPGPAPSAEAGRDKDGASGGSGAGLRGPGACRAPRGAGMEGEKLAKETWAEGGWLPAAPGARAASGHHHLAARRDVVRQPFWLGKGKDSVDLLCDPADLV